MPALADLIVNAGHLSPERSPAEAVDLNQQILALDPTNAAAHVRLARAYQAQRKFAEAKAACQEALRSNSGSTVAKQRLQRIIEEWALTQQAQAINSFEEAPRCGGETMVPHMKSWQLGKALSQAAKGIWGPQAATIAR